MSGGKCANGAVTAAFAHLFNNERHRLFPNGLKAGPPMNEVPPIPNGQAQDPFTGWTIEAASWGVGGPLGKLGVAALGPVVGRIAGNLADDFYYYTDKLPDKAFRKLYKDIKSKGLTNPTITFVEHAGSKYIVHGNNRLAAARLLGITDQLSFAQTKLPDLGYRGPSDLSAISGPRLRGRR